MKINTLRKLFLLYVLLVSVLATQAQEAKLDNFAAQVAQVTEFDVNGLKVIVKRRTSSPTIAGGLFIRGGSRTRSIQNGRDDVKHVIPGPD